MELLVLCFQHADIHGFPVFTDPIRTAVAASIPIQFVMDAIQEIVKADDKNVACGRLGCVFAIRNGDCAELLLNPFIYVFIGAAFYADAAMIAAGDDVRLNGRDTAVHGVGDKQVDHKVSHTMPPAFFRCLFQDSE